MSAGDEGAIRFVQTILASSTWNDDDLYNVTTQYVDRPYTAEPPTVLVQLLDQIRLKVSAKLWRDFLHRLGKPIPIRSNDRFAEHLLNLEPQADIICNARSHVVLLEAAREHARDEEWAADFRRLLYEWLKWETTVGAVERHRRLWTRAVDGGLMRAIYKATSSLDLSPLGRQQFRDIRRRLSSMTKEFRANPSTYEE